MQQTIGDIRITMVRESVTPTPADLLFPEVDRAVLTANAGWLQPDFVDADGNLFISIHAFVVEAGDATIVVDTCVGDRQLPGYDLLADHSAFLDDFRAAGFDPAAVTHVLCTHLHFDHVGWNTMPVEGKWVPTFPNARYLFGRVEYEHWAQAAGPETLALTFDDAVTPIVELGLADLVAGDHRITEGVQLAPTPGHTPGHVSVVMESAGEHAVITGDVLHHPVQFVAPDWLMMADCDHDAATATRRAFIAGHADADILVFGTHFAGSSCGHLVTDSDHHRFELS